uniref:Uncharacterized protein n=2 Tax=Oryza meridionalis TaxID=40149 RepID=A0A0E0DEL8_9ORYZ
MVVREPVAMEIPAVEESAAGRMPPRIRRRLLEGSRVGGGAPTSAEEIEAKLKEAELRRQQFHEWVSCKARKKPRSPSWSSQEEDQGQRLEAKLQAAEQKRLSLLAKAQNRLAKLDELRQAAKNVVEMRIEKEREELGTRVESRVRQAEANRMRLLHAHMQKRAAMKERTARSLVRKQTSERKYTERVKSLILQKRNAAEKKRLALLEAEKRKAQARILHIQRAAKTVCSKRESERRQLQEQLESKLQKAKRQRAEYLKQRGSPRSSAHADYIKHAEFLSTKLARCWKRFLKSNKTTYALVQAYDALGINEMSVKSMPFENLAMLMESPTTLQTTKAVLDRFEKRLLLSQPTGSSSVENIDHLLKRLGSPKRKAPASRSRVAAKKPAKGSETSKLSRYSLRVVLCSYMILAHPGAVLSGQGEKEKLLMESAENFVKEFELLVKTVLDRPGGASTQSTDAAGQKKFRTQLAAFDKAWCAYLYHFVVWKLKDAKSLEQDLVRAACKLELSMMQTCKLSSDGQSHDLSHDMKAIQKQVTDDQKLLREKVQHLSGDAGIERMNSALSDTRSKFFEAKENGNPLTTSVANVSTPLSINSSGQVPNPTSKPTVEGSSFTAQSLPGAASSSSSTSPMKLPTDNEQMVNEMLHEDDVSFAGNSDNVSSAEKDFQAKVKATMEKAFWDLVTDSMRGDKPDYSQLINLVKEVRDSLHELASNELKEEILENIDLEILSQVLQSGSQDTRYLGQILQYSLDMVRKLSAPAKEDDMKRSHEKLLTELAASSEVNDNGISSFVIAVIKGLRFTLEEIKQLQTEVSKARIQLMQPIIKGSAGVEYLQKAFTDRYGPPANASASLPITKQWVSATKSIMEQEWSSHLESLQALPADHAQRVVSVLRAGHGAPAPQASSSAASSSGLPECKGEKIDKLTRVGLLQLISNVEGLNMQSTPETFQINLLRLRAVQDQFQKVIVIATSMLVLHQVLMSKVAPPELQNTISELYDALVKLLDNNADASTKEIVEAMTCSLASVGSLPEEQIQATTELATKMLLKSLQAGDIVFGKVSRAVYFAFRGVVLGGGAKGKKLAEAPLRRLGAAKLANWVVKAGEVLIKMAVISEKIMAVAAMELPAVRAYDALGINETSAKSMPFENLATLMQSPATLQATKAVLDRFEKRLLLLSSSVANIDHLLKHLGSPKKKAPPTAASVSRYSLRVVLCSYMILAHPGAVLSGQGEKEKMLMESAESFVKEFELLVKSVLLEKQSTDAAGQKMFSAQLADFDRAWCAYLYCFVVWKLKDAKSLEDDLVRAACKLELSMMQTCKLSSDGQSHDLSHDMKAIQKQVADDQKLLQEKVQQLSGDAGIERMNSALSDTRSKFFEAKENGDPLATSVANVSTPLSISSSGSGFTAQSLPGASSSSSSTSPMKQPTDNEQMVNEMLHEDDVSFGGNSDNVSSAEKEFQAKVKATMGKAFWDLVTDSMRGDKPDYSQLINLVKEVRDSLHELASKELKEEILENIDLEILSQVLGSGSQDTRYLGQIMHYSLDMIRKLSAPAKEDEMKRSHEKLLNELAASSEVNDNGISSFVIAVIKGLRFTLEEIKQLQTEVRKARIQLMQPIIKGSAGVEYLQKAFADRYGPPADASASLPVTKQWVSATKSIVEQEWSSHLESLQALPADHAQRIVPVLPAGHGAPAVQASSSAASSSGLPECKGEKIDKLTRVGLLQLISNVEGLNMQSTPETFQINLLRLRAVQDQFQKVIVIATSILVLHQVLVSKVAPPELQNAISELYDALVKLLDSNPDASTKEIVEAMTSSLATVGSLPEKQAQATAELATKMLLKSLQAGDVVFGKVSRAVYCAFRGVVLGGGGGGKAKKLAEAPLRRLAAAKLADRVVKAGEVLVKMAAIAEEVHGQWYKALAL